jgi:hypothetical protein
VLLPSYEPNTRIKSSVVAGVYVNLLPPLVSSFDATKLLFLSYNQRYSSKLPAPSDIHQNVYSVFAVKLTLIYTLTLLAFNSVLLKSVTAVPDAISDQA